MFLDMALVLFIIYAITKIYFHYKNANNKPKDSGQKIIEEAPIILGSPKKGKKNIFPDCLKEDTGPKATDSQMSYGKKLGIAFPENVTVKQASYLISSTIDEPMTNFQKSLIKYYGFEMDPSRYASSDEASGLITSKLGETIKVQILLAGVCESIDPKTIDGFREKAHEFRRDEKAIKSFRENFSDYNGIEPIIPGENINRNTTAYKKAKELTLK